MLMMLFERFMDTSRSLTNGTLPFGASGRSSVLAPASAISDRSNGNE